MSTQSVQYLVTLARIRQAQNSTYTTNALSQRTKNGDFLASITTILIFGVTFAGLFVFNF